MTTINDLVQIEKMPRMDFNRQFMSIMYGKAFAHVSAGEGADFEIQEVGEQMYHAGVRCIDPCKKQDVLAAVGVLTQRMYDGASHRS